jgi:hypothetical protein
LKEGIIGMTTFEQIFNSLKNVLSRQRDINIQNQIAEYKKKLKVVQDTLSEAESKVKVVHQMHNMPYEEHAQQI